MFFVTPILAGIILFSTFGAGSYVQMGASDVVSRYNLSQIGHILEIYYVEDGKYPLSLDEVVNEGEIKNIKVENYKYNVSIDGQKTSVSDGEYCWVSEVGTVKEDTNCQI